MKILVRGTNWIGDAVMSIPALRELRRVFSDSQITLHTRSWAYGLFKDADFLDEIVTFDKARWPVKDVYDNSRFLSRDGFDLAILLPNSFESALTTFLSGIPRRIGFNKDVRGLLLTDPVAVPEWKNRRHEVYYYLYLIAQVEKRVLGRETVMDSFPDISLLVSEDRLSPARKYLNDIGVRPTQAVVVLGTGSANSMAKRWPAERFAELNDRLQEELNAAVLLLGSKDDVGVAAAVSALSKNAPIDLSGKTELDAAAAILAISDLMITNDMGLAHVSPAVGTPTIVLFGPTDPETTRPFSQNAEIIRKSVECSPCMHRVCPIDHRCMTQISVDEVFQTAAGVIVPIEEPIQTAGSLR
jgi:heptosyltransferase II